MLKRKLDFFVLPALKQAFTYFIFLNKRAMTTILRPSEVSTIMDPFFPRMHLPSARLTALQGIPLK
jgi:hypothetical protein